MPESSGFRVQARLLNRNVEVSGPGAETTALNRQKGPKAARGLFCESNPSRPANVNRPEYARIPDLSANFQIAATPRLVLRKNLGRLET